MGKQLSQGGLPLISLLLSPSFTLPPLLLCCHGAPAGWITTASAERAEVKLCVCCGGLSFCIQVHASALKCLHAALRCSVCMFRLHSVMYSPWLPLILHCNPSILNPRTKNCNTSSIMCACVKDNALCAGLWVFPWWLSSCFRLRCSHRSHDPECKQALDITHSPTFTVCARPPSSQAGLWMFCVCSGGVSLQNKAGLSLSVERLFLLYCI